MRGRTRDIWAISLVSNRTPTPDLHSRNPQKRATPVDYLSYQPFPPSFPTLPPHALHPFSPPFIHTPLRTRRYSAVCVSRPSKTKTTTKLHPTPHPPLKQQKHPPSQTPPRNPSKSANQRIFCAPHPTPDNLDPSPPSFPPHAQPGGVSRIW